MLLSDISIKRPVFAMVTSLLLLVFGIFAFTQLSVRENPDVELSTVSVSVSYPGASAEVVETKIVQVMEEQLSGIEGLRSISSAARQGAASLTLEFRAGISLDVAAADVREQVSRVVGRMPVDATQPVIQKADSDSSPLLIVALRSDKRSLLELSDYFDRSIQDRLTAIEGVAFVRPQGGYKKPSLRVWLDRRSLAARQLTVLDVENALRRENAEFGAGTLRSTDRDFVLRTARNLEKPEDFENLIVARAGENEFVRLGDVARVEMGTDDPDALFGPRGMALGIIKRPGASALAVSTAVKTEIARLNSGVLPDDVSIVINNDTAEYIRASLRELYIAMGVSAALVIIIVYLFLGTASAALIPAVTVPVSLVATFIVMWLVGFSINIFTFLALVLAIGLVVDDAIIVVENIHRRMKHLGEPPLLAAFRGTRQVGLAVMATTLVLISAFVPVMLLKGATGKLFLEFAGALAAAVGFSMFVALTLTPVMSAKILREKLDHSVVARGSMAAFDAIARLYRRLLIGSLNRPAIILTAFAGISGLAVILFFLLPKEFAPLEDRGSVFVQGRGPEGSTTKYMARQIMQGNAELADLVDRGIIAAIQYGTPGPNSGMIAITLPPVGKRPMTTQEVMRLVTQKLRNVPGVQFQPGVPAAFVRAGSGTLMFALGGDTYEEIEQWTIALTAAIRQHPSVSAVRADYNTNTPQIRIHIDDNRAAALGVSSSTIGQTLQVMLGSRRATTYTERGREYDVILRGRDEDRQTSTDITNIYVRSDTTRELIPLSSVASLKEVGTSTSLNRYNRVRSAGFTVAIQPGYTFGQAVEEIGALVKKTLPPHAQLFWRGEAQEMQESNDQTLMMFGIALLVVFLVLAAQFESFLDPFIIMMTVPLAVAGAFVGILITGQTINMYSQIGIIVLIGLAAKNGILIVEFANQLRDTGMKFRDALVEASVIRLRPIVMTALATIMGIVPLIVSSGAGHENRRAIGVVIFFGVACASIITLFVVPALYQLLARSSPPGKVAAELRNYERAHPLTDAEPGHQPAE